MTRYSSTDDQDRGEGCPADFVPEGAAFTGMVQPDISLPPPKKGKATSLFGALKRRQTIREISMKPLPLQQLANLLWAACGVNRRSGPFGIPGRTAASASNSQEIDVYVATKEGAYLYDPAAHHLTRVSDEDLRGYAQTPGQRNIVSKAPTQLIYVVDLDRLTHTKGFDEPGLHDPEVQKSYYFVDTGLIAGNVYLYAAAQGLAAWFHNCDRHALAQKLDLEPEERVLFAQSVGFPEKG
ncbi:MAG: nitroreductase family protein [Bacillota bacterium]